MWPPHDTQLVPDDWERNLRGERVERRLAAILAGDVAGYSRLLGLDEEGTLAALKGHRRAVVDPKIAEHRGRIVKTTGDGILVEFASIVDALRCAVDIQRQMAERNAEIPPKRRIEFRIGLNVGDIIIDDKDIFGDGVNIATHRLGEAARKAVAADDTDAMAHTALAIFELFSGHHDEARRRLHRALSLNPNSEFARGYLGGSFAFGGDCETALSHLDEAIRLSPRGLLVIIWHLCKGWAALLAERYQEAVRFTEEAREANPEFPDIYAVLASTSGHLGNTASARTALDQLLRRMPGLTANDERLTRPFVQMVDRERFLEGLRKAGLPEKRA